MTPNFKICTHRNEETLHLKLMGDFDGASAHELLNVLKRCGNYTSRVFIHTSCLRNIYAFGLRVFHGNFHFLKGKSIELVFTGEHASWLAPEGSVLSELIISGEPPVAQSGAPNSEVCSMSAE